MCESKLIVTTYRKIDDVPEELLRHIMDRNNEALGQHFQRQKQNLEWMPQLNTEFYFEVRHRDSKPNLRRGYSPIESITLRDKKHILHQLVSKLGSNFNDTTHNFMFCSVCKEHLYYGPETPSVTCPKCKKINIVTIEARDALRSYFFRSEINSSAEHHFHFLTPLGIRNYLFALISTRCNWDVFPNTERVMDKAKTCIAWSSYPMGHMSCMELFIHPRIIGHLELMVMKGGLDTASFDCIMDFINTVNSLSDRNRAYFEDERKFIEKHLNMIRGNEVVKVDNRSNPRDEKVGERDELEAHNCGQGW